jgi:hypothetical protein
MARAAIREIEGSGEAVWSCSFGAWRVAYGCGIDGGVLIVAPR